MKKLNFKNEDFGDDRALIEILKTSTVKAPSEQFVDETMKKFLALRTSGKARYKAVKLPLYLMAVLGIFLLAPILWKIDLQQMLTDLIPEGISNPETPSTKMNLWYLITPILLFITARFVIWAERIINGKGSPII